MPPPRKVDVARVYRVLRDLELVGKIVSLYRHPVLDTGSQGLSKGDDIAIANRATLVRNDGKELSPRPLRERARVRGENVAIAEQVRNDEKRQTEKTLVPSKRAAFTLAEVLITLGIIGVVAAMTMPTLISNHQKKVLTTKAKKTYSNIQNAFLAIQNDYGTIGDNSVLYDSSVTGTKIAQELLPHFNGAKFCKSKTCPEINYTIKYAKDYYGEGGVLRTLNLYNYTGLLLPDGTIIMSVEMVPNCYNMAVETNYDKDGNKTTYQRLRTYCGTMFFDVNGPKPPNEFGKDVFSIKINKNKIVPDSWSVTGGYTLTNILIGKE